MYYHIIFFDAQAGLDYFVNNCQDLPVTLVAHQSEESAHFAILTSETVWDQKNYSVGCHFPEVSFSFINEPRFDRKRYGISYNLPGIWPIKAGWYSTRKGYLVSFTRDAAPSYLDNVGSVIGVGLVLYKSNGIFALKDQYPQVGDNLDLLPGSWSQERPEHPIKTSL